MTPLFQHIFPRRTLTHTTRLVCERAARGRRVKNDPHPPTPLHPFPKMGFVVTYDRLYVRAYVTTEYMCIWRTARRESRLQRDHSSVTSHTRECLHAPPSDHRRTSHVIRPITGVPTHTRTQRSNPSGATDLDFCQDKNRTEPRATEVLRASPYMSYQQEGWTYTIVPYVKGNLNGQYVFWMMDYGKKWMT